MSDPVLWPQVVTFITNFMLKPMVDFANTHSEAGGAVTNLIVVPEMERPGGEPIGDPGTSLAGLAISPALLAEFARTMPDEAEIWAGVNLPANFTPMMALGSNVLKRAGAVDPELRDLGRLPRVRPHRRPDSLAGAEKPDVPGRDPGLERLHRQPG